MTMFEYLMVLVAIVLGLSLTQVLRGMSKLARSDSAYITVTLWAIVLFYLHVQAWWALWDLNSTANWNQAYFTYIVLIPCAMFGATELLLPMGTTPETNWREHFFSVRRWFFVMMIVVMLLATMLTWVFADTPLTHPYRINQAFVISTFIIGFVSSRPQIQVWLPVAALGGILFGQLLFRFLPGLD